MAPATSGHWTLTIGMGRVRINNTQLHSLCCAVKHPTAPEDTVNTFHTLVPASLAWVPSLQGDHTCVSGLLLLENSGTVCVAQGQVQTCCNPLFLLPGKGTLR